MVPTLLLITAVVFAVVKLAPGNPFSMAQSSGEAAVKQMNPADYEALLQRYGLDSPGTFSTRAGSGDPGHRRLSETLSPNVARDGGLLQRALQRRGESGSLGARLDELLSSKFGATLFLNVLALSFMVAVALPIGLRAAAKRGGWFDG